jgi:hypothetical protein
VTVDVDTSPLADPMAVGAVPRVGVGGEHPESFQVVLAWVEPDERPVAALALGRERNGAATERGGSDAQNNTAEEAPPH